MSVLELIQAVCSLGALIIAAWTLAILRHYAADTKKIAGTSVQQLESSQTPFVTPVLNRDDGWRMENQGSGPALNGAMTFVQNGQQVFPLPNLSVGAIFNFHNVFAPLVGNQGGITIEYDSLSGRTYRTLVTWGEAGTMRVRFEKS